MAAHPRVMTPGISVKPRFEVGGREGHGGANMLLSDFNNNYVKKGRLLAKYVIKPKGSKPIVMRHKWATILLAGAFQDPDHDSISLYECFQGATAATATPAIKKFWKHIAILIFDGPLNYKIPSYKHLYNAIYSSDEFADWYDHTLDAAFKGLMRPGGGGANFGNTADTILPALVSVLVSSNKVVDIIEDIGEYNPIADSVQDWYEHPNEKDFPDFDDGSGKLGIILAEAVNHFIKRGATYFPNTAEYRFAVGIGQAPAVRAIANIKEYLDMVFCGYDPTTGTIHNPAGDILDYYIITWYTVNEGGKITFKETNPSTLLRRALYFIRSIWEFHVDMRKEFTSAASPVGLNGNGPTFFRMLRETFFKSNGNNNETWAFDIQAAYNARFNALQEKRENNITQYKRRGDSKVRRVHFNKDENRIYGNDPHPYEATAFRKNKYNPMNPQIQPTAYYGNVDEHKENAVPVPVEGIHPIRARLYDQIAGSDEGRISGRIGQYKKITNQGAPEYLPT